MPLRSTSSAGEEPSSGFRRSRSRRAFRAAGFLALLLLLVFAGGFLVFADRVVSARQPDRPKADGIVALTGGAGRIEDAVRLLDRGSAERLLISGVNERTSAEALADRGPRIAGLMSCCIDIGYEAQDTRGNAAEAGKWVRERGYRSIIVVTSAYHMPRSLTEIAQEIPEVELIPYPVTAESSETEWFGDTQLFQLLLAEYLKYIVARFA